MGRRKNSFDLGLLPDLDRRRPLYEAVADAIDGLIRNGVLKPGSLVPSQKQLEERYGVSQQTVRQAILNLTNRGSVVAIHGKGVLVLEARVAGDLFLPEVEVGTDTKTTSTLRHAFILVEKIVPPKRVAKYLHLSEDARTIRCRRKILLGDRVLGLETINFDCRYQGRADRAFADNASFGSMLRNDVAESIAYAQTKIIAGSLTAFDADLLKVLTGRPLLQRITVFMDMDEKPLAMIRTAFLGDQVELTTQPFPLQAVSDHEAGIAWAHSLHKTDTLT